MTAERYHVTGARARAVDDGAGRRAIEVRVEIAGQAPGSAASGSAVVPLGDPVRGDPVPDEPARDGRGGEDRLAARVATITEAATDLLAGRRWRSLGDVDAALHRRAGTAAQARLGEPDTLGVSMAAARAFAAVDGVALYRWLPRVAARRLPRPCFGVVRGGRHAENRVDFERFAIVPTGARSFAEALRAGAQVHDRLGAVLERIGFRTRRGGDAMFTPALQAPGDVLDLVCEAIAEAGYEAGPRGVAVAVDVSAAWLREPDGCYRVNGARLDAVHMVDYLAHLVDRYPIASIENPMADDDAKGWRLLAERLADRVQLIGGGGPAAPPPVAGMAAQQGPAVSIEPGRAATVSEMMAIARRGAARGAGAVVSRRAGDTDEEFVADFAVAVGCGQLAAGPPGPGGRAALYERLRAVEAADKDLPYAGAMG